MKRIRLQIAYRSSVDRCQDRMLGWVSIFALWDTCLGYQYYCSGKPHPIRVLFVFYPTLLHVKPVNAAASRASSSRLKLPITLAESVSFRHGELPVKQGLWSSQVPISRNFKFNGYKKVATGIGSKGRSRESPSTSPSI